MYLLVHSDIENLLLKRNDGRDRRPNLLFMLFGVLPMLRLKLWSTKEKSHHPAFVGNWPTILRTFLALFTHCHWINSPSRK